MNRKGLQVARPLRLHALHIAVAGEHARHATVFIHEADNFADRSAAATSHYCDFHVMNRRQRIEQAIPLLAALPADPQLTGRRAEVKRGRVEPVDVHRVALHREVGLLLRQPTGETAP